LRGERNKLKSRETKSIQVHAYKGHIHCLLTIDQYIIIGIIFENSRDLVPLYVLFYLYEFVLQGIKNDDTFVYSDLPIIVS
jgi:hypothetical protein